MYAAETMSIKKQEKQNWRKLMGQIQQYIECWSENQEIKEGNVNPD